MTTLLGDPKDVLKLGEGKKKKKDFLPFLGTPVSPLWRMAVHSPSSLGQAPCSHLSCLPPFVLYPTWKSNKYSTVLPPFKLQLEFDRLPLSHAAILCKQPSFLAWATAETLWEVSAPPFTLKF